MLTKLRLCKETGSYLVCGDHDYLLFKWGVIVLTYQVSGIGTLN